MLPAAPASAGAARRALDRLGPIPRGALEDAGLLVTELVTSSIRHAGFAPDAPLRLEAWWSGAALEVRVREPGCVAPADAVPGTPVPRETSGCRLHLLDRIAARWGDDERGWWFVLEPPTTAASPTRR